MLKMCMKKSIDEKKIFDNFLQHLNLANVNEIPQQNDLKNSIDLQKHLKPITTYNETCHLKIDKTKVLKPCGSLVSKELQNALSHCRS